MRARSRSLWVLMLALGLMLMPLSVAASPPPPENRHGSIVSEISLQPEPGSDVVVENMRAIVWEDGAVSVRGSGKGVAGQLQTFSYQVDLEERTYSTTLLESATVAPSAGASGDMSRSMANDYVARVNVLTEDIVHIDMAETMYRLQWTVSGGSITWAYSELGCWEKRPTVAGTNWYEDFCTKGYLDSTALQTWQSSYGRYYNYDWGDPGQSTWTEHTIQFSGYYTGGFNYDWEVTSWGEDSGNLHGAVTSCGCY